MRVIDCAEVIPVKEKSVKHLTKTFAVVSLLIPMSAQPLGIGDIQLHSALNQQLNAEIRLSLAPGENPADVSVRLAAPEKFDQAGVPWNYFLSKINFKPITKPDGSVVIKITSREPLTEPFLDFLLEVNWPQGSQFREFTVLIDPPAAYNAPAIPSTASSHYQTDTFEDNYSTPIRKEQTSKRRSTQVKLASHISPATPTNGQYGPTKNADTLWHIAEQLGNERNIPTRQMMAALFRANPDAFIRGNVDFLKTGVVLKIPETAAITQSTNQASQQKTADKKVALTETPATGSKSLELVAPSDAKANDTLDISGQVKPGQDDSEANRKITETGSGATEGKDIELQTRIERLEQQLNMMQQLLALKDQQLSALQNNDQKAAEQAATSAQKLPTPEPTTSEPQTTPTQPVATQPPTTETQQPAAEIQPAPVTVKPKPPKPTPPTPIVEEESFLSSPSYLVTIGGFTVSILGLLGWLLWRKRKIENQTNTASMFATASQIRMPDTDNSSLSVPVMDMSSTDAYDVGTVGESSFISDFTPSDFEAFDTDQNEIDPLSEADVYLAYGRYQQAEDLIRNAIEEQPDKDEYKLKLLEIFYANENKDSFAAYAQELSEAGKATNISFWSKVSDMAKDIIPESALFGGTETAAPSSQNSTKQTETKPTTESNESAIFDIDDDLDLNNDFSNDDLIDLSAPSLPDMTLMDDVDSEIAELQLNEPQQAKEEDDNSLDFDLSSFSDDQSTQKSMNSDQVISDIESIDFDLSNLDADTTEREQKLGDAGSLNDFDFNFDLDATDDKAEASDTQDKEPLDMATLESFEFPEFDANEEEPKQADANPEIKSDTSADEFDFNFDFDAPSSISSDEESDLGVSDLTDMDEYETKIDLAKAYIDMGDTVAAMAIAKEVLEKGSSEQKQAAQALLDELK